MFLHLQKLPMKSVGHRPLLVKWGGVRIENVQKVFIGGISPLQRKVLTH